MRPVSFQILSVMPGILALFFVFLFATPMDSGHMTFTPNVAWLMTMVMVAHYPPAWPRAYAFFLGLLQDVLFGTPLGSQALLVLLLAQWVSVQSARHQVQLFRLRWMEAAGVLVVWHLLLWAIIHLVTPDSASLRGMLYAGVMNAIWYPAFYWFNTRAFAALPDVK